MWRRHGATHKADRSNASFNLLGLTEGYARAGSWLEEDCVRTRLGEETMTIRLARICDQKLLPWQDREPNETRAWALSEVSLNARWLAGAKIAANWREVVERIRASWPKWQKDILIAPVDENGRLLLDSIAQPLAYGKNGLEKE